MIQSPEDISLSHETFPATLEPDVSAMRGPCRAARPTGAPPGDSKSLRTRRVQLKDREHVHGPTALNGISSRNGHLEKCLLNAFGLKYLAFESGPVLFAVTHGKRTRTRHRL